MTDLVKKYEELQQLTEGIFNRLFNKVKTPPSIQQSTALKSYRDKYQILFRINDPAVLNKKFNASELINMYKNNEINNNTQVKEISKGKTQWIPFKNFLKYEPYKSALKDFLNNEENNYTKPILNVVFTNLLPNRLLNKKIQIELKFLAKVIKKNPAILDWIKVFDNSKWVYLKNSSYFPEIEKWINYYRT